MIITDDEKSTKVCSQCQQKFHKNLLCEDGIYRCFSSRQKCLSCNPYKPKKRDENIEKNVILNYENYGASWCMEEYNLTKNQLYGIVQKFNLKLNRSVHSKIRSSSKLISENAHKVNHAQFIKIDSPTAAYILGLLWTDGHISKNTNTITFTTTYPDAEYFKTIFDKTGNWGYCKTIPKNSNWKHRLSIYTTNRFLKDFLVNLNFTEKDKGFTSLYGSIPVEYRKFFLIGIIDGDGCFYVNDKNSSYKFSICSSIEQDWTCLENYFKQNSIECHIERTISKNGSYSKIYVFGKDNIKKIWNLLYNDYTLHLIGLPRKYEKCNYINNLPKRKKKNITALQ